MRLQASIQHELLTLILVYVALAYTLKRFLMKIRKEIKFYLIFFFKIINLFELLCYKKRLIWKQNCLK
jgi:hypothetical protein